MQSIVGTGAVSSSAVVLDASVTEGASAMLKIGRTSYIEVVGTEFESMFG